MGVTQVKQSKNNNEVEYINPKELKDKVTVYSKALFLRIDTGEDKKLSLKIGRYKKTKFLGNYIKADELESDIPKSELTLDPEELENLVSYINENYYPLSNNETNYLSLDENTMSKLIKDDPQGVSKLIQTAINLDMDLSDINKIVEIKNRQKALEEFVENYKNNALESVWQKWFENNNWIFGSSFVKMNADRRIDVENISDFIMENIDGFVDVIEIKRPSTSKNFFETNLDHGNLVPSQELTKAITQLSNYLIALEKKSNDMDTFKRLGKILRPRGILIFGNSHKWEEKEYEAYRILNSTLNNITIYTYNMVLQRARKMNEYLSKKQKN